MTNQDLHGNPVTAPDGMARLQDELDKTNRRLRRLQRWGMGAACVLAVIAAGALVAAGMNGGLGSAAHAQTSPAPTQAAATVMTVNQLIVVDDQKRARAALGMIDGVGPALVLYDENGAGRTMYALDASGPVITMFDKKNKNRLRLNSADAVGPSLIMRDANGKTRSVIGLANEKPSIQLLDAAGAIVWSPN